MFTQLIDRPLHAVRDAPGTTPLLTTVASDLPVPLLGGGATRYVDLDVAATAPALSTVADHLSAITPYLGSVHRGAGLPSRWATALHESARESVAGSIGARPDDVIVFARNTTDALNLLARAVPATCPVVVLDVEHHANLLPWLRRGAHLVEHAPTWAQTHERLSAALAAAPGGLLAITGASNVTGEVLPLHEIVALARRHDVRVAVDAAQLAPHRRVDLAGSGADYVAFSGHKLYAPFGAGVLAGRRDWLDAAEPYLAGGGAVREVTTTRTDWAPAPQRHEAGTPNLSGAVAIAGALTALDALDDTVRETHESAIRTRIADGLDALEGVTRHRIFADLLPAIGVVAFSVAGHPAGRVAAYLSAEHGVGVRDGRFCAHPLLARLGLRGGAVRASVGVHSSFADADRLVEAIEHLTTDGLGHEYVETAHGWEPVGDDRAAPAALARAGLSFPTSRSAAA